MALVAAGPSERTLIVFTTDHGLPFPGEKATLPVSGVGVNLSLRGPKGFGRGKDAHALLTHLDP